VLPWLTTATPSRARVADGEALVDVRHHRRGMSLDRGGHRGVVAVLAGGRGRLEEAIVVLGVGGGDDQQVVLEPERRADVAARGGRDVGVDDRAEPVGGRGRRREREQQCGRQDDASHGPAHRVGRGCATRQVWVNVR
jgi:hypothetical protein